MHQKFVVVGVVGLVGVKTLAGHTFVVVASIIGDAVVQYVEIFPP